MGRHANLVQRAQLEGTALSLRVVVGSGVQVYVPALALSLLLSPGLDVSEGSAVSSSGSRGGSGEGPQAADDNKSNNCGGKTN